MTIATPISFEASLKAQYAAVKHRIAQAGIRHRANDNAPMRVSVAKPPRPEWKVKATSFDAHVDDYKVHLSRLVSPKRSYLIDRARDYGYTLSEIREKSRNRPLVRARQTIASEIKDKWPLTSYPELARLLGMEGHTTALHAVRRGRSYRSGIPYVRRPSKKKVKE